MFVTFEGVEGAGKSTALKNMARELGQEGADVLARCLECYRECRDRLSRDQRRRANGSI